MKPVISERDEARLREKVERVEALCTQRSASVRQGTAAVDEERWADFDAIDKETTRLNEEVERATFTLYCYLRACFRERT